MEPLRIRIPTINVCKIGECLELTKNASQICKKCRLDSWVRQEMTTTALASKTELIHSSPFRRYLCG
jgi:hypothetical protein